LGGIKRTQCLLVWLFIVAKDRSSSTPIHQTCLSMTMLYFTIWCSILPALARDLQPLRFPRKSFIGTWLNMQVGGFTKKLIYMKARWNLDDG
jgi:hypothetical protein